MPPPATATGRPARSGCSSRRLPTWDWGGFYAHGIMRDAYLFPLAENLQDVIRRDRRQRWLDRPFDEIAGYWKARWAIPRSRRIPSWRDFDSEKFMKETMVMIR